MTPQSATKVVWQSAAVWPLGYARYSSELLRALEGLGVQVAYRFVYRGSAVCGDFDEPRDTGDPALDRMKQAVANPDLPQVVCASPDLFPRNFGRYRIGSATTEVNGIPGEWVEHCNRMDEVWVMSPFNERAFQESGVTRPLFVMPGGVDPLRFNPEVQGYPLRDRYLFLSVFEWSERKAPEILLRAFNREFRRHEEAVLFCKIMVPPWAPFDVPAAVRALRLAPSGGRIVVDLNTYLPGAQLGRVYRSADCFVMPTRGEGWGLPIFEAMACGLPVIATQWGATADYVNEEIAYPLRSKKLVTALGGKYPYSGYQWAEPDEEHLRSLMRHVFEHRGEAGQRGQKASQFVLQELTWERAASRVVDRLRQIADRPGPARPSRATASPRPLRIGIDVSRTVPPRERAGIGTYALTLVEGLSRVDPINQYVLYPGLGEFIHPDYDPLCEIPVPRQGNFRAYSGPLPALAPGRPPRGMEGASDEVDLVHATAFASPDVAPAKLVVTIFDMTYRLFPDLHLPSNVAFCEAQMQAALHRAAQFIAISEHTKRDFLSCYPVAEGRVRVIPLAVRHAFAPPTSPESVRPVLRKYGIHSHYIFSLGSLEPRKNLSALLRAFAQLRTSGTDDLRLVVAGCPGWLNSEAHHVADQLQIADRVQFLGYVDDDDLPALYGGARMFVYPSLYEGFGLPVLEAMSCGVPVLISRTSSHPEVAGEAALYFDPRNVDELTEQMARMALDASLREACRRRSLERSRCFSVERMAWETLRVYEEVVLR